MKLNKNTIQLILIAIMAVLIVLFLLFRKLEKVQTQTIEVEKYIIKESEKKFDSLEIELKKSKKEIENLNKKRHEIVENHKPLERIFITDSIRTNNVNRFFK